MCRTCSYGDSPKTDKKVVEGRRRTRAGWRSVRVIDPESPDAAASRRHAGAGGRRATPAATAAGARGLRRVRRRRRRPRQLLPPRRASQVDNKW